MFANLWLYPGQYVTIPVTPGVNILDPPEPTSLGWTVRTYVTGRYISILLDLLIGSTFGGRIRMFPPMSGYCIMLIAKSGFLLIMAHAAAAQFTIPATVIITLAPGVFWDTVAAIKAGRVYLRFMDCL
jgi:hypothetical protein